MKPNEPGQETLSDAEIARRALKLLAERKTIPTPETFAEAFLESAGAEVRGGGPPGVVKAVGADLVRQSRMTQHEAAQMLQAAQRQQWNAVRETIDRALALRPGGGADAWPPTMLVILRQIELQHPNWTRARKLESISRIIDGAGSDPSVVLDRLRRLVESWGPPQGSVPGGSATPPPSEFQAGAQPECALDGAGPAAGGGDDAGSSGAPGAVTKNGEAWRRLALRGLSALGQACTSAEVRDKLQGYMAQAADGTAFEPAPPLLDWMAAIEREMAEEHRVRSGLQRLLGLLCENLGQLAPDEAWLTRQLEPVRALLAGPIRSGQIAAAERCLTLLIQQQSVAQNGLHQAKVALTEMLAAVIERIGTMDSTAGRFNGQVGGYREQLLQAPDAATLSRIVQGLLTDTHTVCEQIEASRAQLTEARKKVGIFEARVSQLEHQLNEVSTLVHKDPLTNVLNRRGFEQAFRSETSRALRYESPLTLAMIDLDNFKQVNDRLGHVAGDRALVHFVTTVHATLRPTDLSARSGGEEFGVLFPASSMQEGFEAIERLQRELARRPFLFEQARVQMTFSAGVAQWRPGESFEQLMQRADASLYEAKKAGKNRVLKAP